MQESNNVKVYTTDEIIGEYLKNLIDEGKEEIDIRFKLHNEKDGALNEELGFYEGRLMWLYAMEDFEINISTLGYLWEKIDPQVDFMTAAGSGKEVRVEHKFTMGTYCSTFNNLDDIMSELADSLVAANLADVIINGRWYIKS
ncbi:MAG TPA: hypothetical protein VFC98_00440 [Clostridia bacterium]|nr:hypothetical protein [Clostridia bacterium]